MHELPKAFPHEDWTAEILSSKSTELGPMVAKFAILRELSTRIKDSTNAYFEFTQICCSGVNPLADFFFLNEFS